MGRFFVIPIPWTHGYINLCDAGILIAALLLGPAYGTAVGGFGDVWTCYLAIPSMPCFP
ncbi:MAG: ECF transporter S component [Limosilactobacillus pontis]